MNELNSLRKKNGETLDCNEWNKLVSVINYIIEFYNQYPTKLSEFENDINLVSEENIAPVIQELINNGTLSSILGEPGADGKSAYLLALENGFIGTVTEWLASLKGLKGSDGKSAFVLAIDNGYTGTLQQWLDSLKGQPGINGENGIDGKSAYLSYVDTTSDNPILTEEEWIASLKGEQGENGLNGSNGQDGLNGITPHIDLTTGNWFIGETDTEVHAQGPTGSNGSNGADGITPHIDSTTGNWFIGTTDTGVHALGPTGQNGSDATVDTSKFLQSPINNNGHDYVEIGGIKWATMNVGASSITDYGLYFQWGDTQGYTASQVGTGSGLKYFGWSDYKYHEGTPLNNGYDPDTITKYGSNDNLTILQISDDAVNAAWGGDWRMPTRDEFLNLYEHTTISWVNNYQNSGINGRLFIDRTDNSKVLFFPAAGDFWFGTTNQIGQSGFYWTSDKYSYSSARNISFNNNSFTTYDNHYKYNGFSIRGICDCSSIASKVAVTGDYNDLINKPVISGGGTVVQSNWNETDTSSPAYILNKPTILNGTNGKSAYELYVNSTSDNPVKTLQEWLASLQGTNGKSAYLSYLDNTSDNPVLSEADWIASLHGSNGQDGQNGLNGLNGITPSIDPTTKHWMIGSTDTGIIAEGLNGTDGTNGTNGTNGTDGITPHIDPVTKHWMIGSTDTNVVAEGKDGTASAAGADGKSAYQSYVDTTSDDPILTELLWVASLHGADGTNGLNGTNGQDGVTPTIDPTTKHWMLGSTDTGVIAEGQNGTNGTNGTNGITPHIDQTSGNWMIGETDTGVKAQGPSGNDGSNGTNGINGTDGITPTVSVTNITGGHNIAFNYGTGDSRNTDFNVMDGTSLSNENASSGGNTLSAVTTGEKYIWNLKANIWSGTQAQYDAITTPDANTIYIITASS